ncbi:MAG: hypothetical protein PGN07_06935 [Aeromicrobium erythreum]
MTDQPGENGQSSQPPSGPPQGPPSGPPQGAPSGPPSDPPTQQFATPSGPPQGAPYGQPPQGPPSGPPQGPQQFGGFPPGGQPPKKSKKGLIIGLVSGGVALLLILGVAIVFVVIQAGHRADVEEADRAATRYDIELRSYRSRAYSTLSSRSTTPSSLKSEISRLASGVPEAPEVPEYGKKNSERFKDSLEDAEGIKDAIEGVEDAAEDATEAQAYADAAERLVANTPSSLLPSTTTTGSKVRSQIVDVLQSRLDAFNRLETPDGMESLKQTATTQMNSVISNAKKAASDLDDGARSVFIRYGSQYSLIRSAVFTAESKSRTELRQAISNVLTADRNSADSDSGDSNDGDDV